MSEQETYSGPGRKIKVPAYVCPLGPRIRNMDPACDHDYPDDSCTENDVAVKWRCTRCGGTIEFEIYN